MIRPALKTDDPDPIEAAVDEAIRLAGDDPREAIRGLILGAARYEEEIAQDVSAGYVRRGLTDNGRRK